ncbi:MAG TPA: lysylphosphatidylglycerol synthase transmembrane domain-containing protein [Flavipsychrobacter sp.]
MNKKTLLTILQYVVFLGLGIAIIFYMMGQLSEQDKAEMMAAIKGVRLWMMVPIVIVGFLSHWFRALRWKLILEPLDIKPTTINTFFSVMIGYIANLALPRAGEVAKCTVLARYEKVPADKMIGTIVAERAFDVLCLGLITAFAFITQAGIIGDYAQDVFGKIAAKTNVFIFVLVALVLMIVVLVMIYKRFKESKVGRFIKGLGDGVRSILQLKKRGMFLLYTALIWGCYWFLVMLGFWSMESTEHLGMLAALVVLIFGSIGMITTQGGIGAYPYLVGKILLFYGIDKAYGQAFGWVSWTVQTGIIILLGVLSLVLLPVYNRTPHNAQDTVDRK